MGRSAREARVVYHEGGLVLVDLPENVQRFSGELIERLTREYFGEPIDEDLLFCMSWEVRRFIRDKLDDVD